MKVKSQVISWLLLITFIFPNCSFEHEDAEYCNSLMENLEGEINEVEQTRYFAFAQLRSVGAHITAINNLGYTLRALYRSCNEDGAETITTSELEVMYDNLIRITNELKSHWYSECLKVECGPWPDL